MPLAPSTCRTCPGVLAGAPEEVDRPHPAPPMLVRVVDYTVADAARPTRLFTTLLDPERVPATELAAVRPDRPPCPYRAQA